jgi:hypothetical protein
MEVVGNHKTIMIARFKSYFCVTSCHQQQGVRTPAVLHSTPSLRYSSTAWLQNLLTRLLVTCRLPNYMVTIVTLGS